MQVIYFGVSFVRWRKRTEAGLGRGRKGTEAGLGRRTSYVAMQWGSGARMALQNCPELGRETLTPISHWVWVLRREVGLVKAALPLGYP